VQATRCRRPNYRRQWAEQSGMYNTKRILIADDRLRSRQGLFLSIENKGLSALLTTQPGIEIVGQANDGREAL